MALSKIPFIQGEAENSRFPINVFFQKEYKNGRDAMKGTPGLTARVESMISGEVRGLSTSNDGSALYAVVGDKVYIVNKNWVATAATKSLKTFEGPVYINHGLTQSMISDGLFGYEITRSGNTPTVVDITSPGFGTPKSQTFQDAYYIISWDGEFYFQISSPDDCSSWAAIDVKSVEGKADPIKGIISNHRQLLVLCSYTGEVYYNSGDSVFPFERYPDVFIENGLGATHSLINIDNSVMYLDDNFFIRRMEGFTPKIVSSFKLSKEIKDLSTKEDAISYTYHRDGSIFYVLTFPSSDRTYVINVGTGHVHRWSSGLDGGRHKSNCHAFFNGMNIVGDYSNGKLYSLEDDVYTDDGDTIKWVYTSPQYYESGNLISFRELQVLFESGVGIQSGQGSDPKVMLRYSNDDMHTWEDVPWADLGKIGKYRNMVRWTQLGTSDIRHFEISGTDPVERTFMQGNLDFQIND